MAPSIENIPAEIIRNIAACLPRNDLYALRRTGKRVSNGCQDEFIHTLKDVFIYPYQLVSLKCLHEIAAIPVYADAVESIRLIIAHFAGRSDERQVRQMKRKRGPRQKRKLWEDILTCPDGPNTGIDDWVYGSKQNADRKKENYRLLVEALPKFSNLWQMTIYNHCRNDDYEDAEEDADDEEDFRPSTSQVQTVPKEPIRGLGVKALSKKYFTPRNYDPSPDGGRKTCTEALVAMFSALIRNRQKLKIETLEIGQIGPGEFSSGDLAKLIPKATPKMLMETFGGLKHLIFKDKHREIRSADARSHDHPFLLRNLLEACRSSIESWRCINEVL